MRWRVAIVLVAVGLALGLGACGGDGDSSRAGVATELADTWGEGWDSNDPEAVASVFTADGVYSSFNGQDYVGASENADHVERMGAAVNDLVRVGELARTPEGTCTWEIEAELAGERVRGMLEMDLEDGLISHLRWLVDPEPIG